MVTDTGGGKGGVTCAPTTEPQTIESQDDSGASNAEETSQECNETTVGAAVGASLGAALVAALGGIWFLLQRQKKLAGSMAQYPPGVQSQVQEAHKYAGPSEAMYRQPMAEMDTVRQYELDTDSRGPP